MADRPGDGLDVPVDGAADAAGADDGGAADGGDAALAEGEGDAVPFEGVQEGPLRLPSWRLLMICRASARLAAGSVWFTCCCEKAGREETCRLVSE
ncbi:MAG TPA: hypothetical protein VIG41_06040 [Micrococcaceae bacterium]